MKPLIIHCPHCLESSKLYLASQPYFMVLNCPVCHDLLLFCEGITYEMEDTQVFQLKDKEIAPLLSSIKKKPSSIKACNHNQNRPVTENTPLFSSVTHKIGEPVRNAPIKKDDLINLKIDLECSLDVSVFVNKI
ncbi:MAG: hypothetical protein HQK83_06460 [Fibrobacteria bacterium]|nr:hypothetical protein [Fibrobacteria bacterium]